MNWDWEKLDKKVEEINIEDKNNMKMRDWYNWRLKEWDMIQNCIRTWWQFGYCIFEKAEGDKSDKRSQRDIDE